MSEPAFTAFVRHYFVRPIDCFSELTGRVIAWLTLVMAVVTLLVVCMRYLLGMNSIALQESVTYMHAAVFMLGSAYTLRNEGHVRVDIFYRRFSPSRQAWVNSLGALVLLLPMCGFLLAITWHYVMSSWRIGEVSPEAGGIPAVFLLKTLMPLMAVTLALQAVAELLRNLLCLMLPGSAADD